MNLSEAGRSGQADRGQADATDNSAEPLVTELDAIAAVAAHAALNSLAFIVATLHGLQLGGGIDPADGPLFLSRAIKHTGRINALLHDLVLGLPIGLSPVVEERSTVQANYRFGVGRGVGMDSTVEIRPPARPPSRPVERQAVQG